MATHVQQHYVPRFLLERWHSGPDGKLTQFQWLRGALRADRFTAKAVAKEEHLYSQRRSEGEPNVALERDFLGPHIDEPAANAHRKILLDGHQSLSSQERYEWSRFLLSLLVRTPQMVAFLRGYGRQVMEQMLDEQPEGMAHLRKNNPAMVLREWAEVHRPHLLDDVGVRALPTILTSQELNQALLDGAWSTESLAGSNVDALITDNPVVYLGDIKKGFSFMLPIATDRAFVVASHPDDMARVAQMRRTGLTKSLNRHLVKHASRYVYATGLQHQNLIKKHLRQAYEPHP